VLRSAQDAPDVPSHHQHIAPAAELAWCIEHYWSVRWDLRGRPAQTAQTLPHPSAHWVFESGRAELAGLHTTRFTRELSSLGHVFGIKFKPGGLRPWIATAVSSLSNRRLPLASVIDPALAETLLTTVQRHADDEVALIRAIEQPLRAAMPAFDPRVAELSAWVLGIMHDRSIVRVEQLCVLYQQHERKLQRLFHDYVGASPKWVINRYRLHEAIERLHGGVQIDWADLAVQLGYYDQAHFISDFRELVGQTPGEYVRHLRTG
jgi:AraC-like DNA-binding protein